jgi:hypothetical protein
MDWISALRARRHVRASDYRAVLENLPDGLEAHWRHSAPQEYPGIRTDAFFSSARPRACCASSMRPGGAALAAA